MPRLFIGTFLPPADQERLGKLHGQSEELETRWKRKIRWVRPQKLHLTWVFLGEVAGELIEPVSDMLSNLVSKELAGSKQPLQITFDKPEIWPEARKPRQLVVTTSDPPDRVVQLAKTLKNGLLEFYLEQSHKDDHPSFRPHLTLMRIERRQERESFPRPPAPRVKISDIEGTDAALPVVLTVNKIALVESSLGKAASYQILHEVALPCGSK